jgi:DNA-binding CsgD family transcriptional regulator
MDDQFWEILTAQPGVGVLIVEPDGTIAFANQQAIQIYYGCDVDPIGKSIEELEGKRFAAERMLVVEKVLATGLPHIIRHIRGGKLTQATLWRIDDEKIGHPRILTVTRQGVLADEDKGSLPVFESSLVDLGPLDVLTQRELQVLILIGHGQPQKTIAQLLGTSLRTIEKCRTDIAAKLKVSSIADITRIVQAAGLDIDDADAPRLHSWLGSSTEPEA